MDQRATRAVPGVVDVVSLLDGLAQDAHRERPTHGSEVRYYNEPIALVVGETFEAARAGAMALSVTTVPTAGRLDFAAHLGETDRPPDGVTTAFSEQGDLDSAMCEAAVTVDGVWTTPSQHSAAMEHAIAGNRRVPIATLVGSGLTADGEIVPGETKTGTMQSAYGAHFCEVAVDAYTGEVRVARWLSVITAGRILNERTARSQCIGGITFEIGGR